MSSLNTITGQPSDRLIENMRDIPFSIHEHLLGQDTILRPKQKEAINGVSNTVFDGNRAVAMIMPTGTGKTVIAAGMINGLKQDEEIGRKAKRTLFISDSVEGILQTKEKMLAYANINLPAYYQDEKSIDGPVIATTYNSWQREDFPIDPEMIDLVILDEAHKSITEARLEMLKKYKNAVWMALTASPDYSELRSVLNYFELGFRMNIREAVQHKLISSFRNIVLNSDIEIELDDIGITSATDDFNQKQLEKALNTKARNLIGAEYLLFSSHPDTGQPIKDIRGIVSCTGINHAKDFALQVNDLYKKHYPAGEFEHGFIRVVYGDMKKEEDSRADILKWHKEGKIGYLAYADLLNQNYDDKGIGICLNLRLSQSTVVVTQRGGRAERLEEGNPNKIALIIDMLDKYQGKTNKRPLLYGEAIGEIAIITEDVEQAAQLTKFGQNRNGFSRFEAIISDEMKEITRNIDLKIITNEESILEIICAQDEKKSIRNRVEDDLIATEIAEITDVSKNTVFRTFEKIKEEWDLYNLNSEKNQKPIVEIEQVRASRAGPPSDSIKKGQLDYYINKYLGEKIARRKNDDDLIYSDIVELTGWNAGINVEAFKKIEKDWQDYESEPNKRSVPPMNVTKVKMPNGKLAYSIRRQDLDIYLKTYILHGMSVEKTADDLTNLELVKMTGFGRQTIMRAFKKIQDEWLLHQSDSEKYSKPEITLKKVKTPNNQVMESIDQSYYNIFLSKYLSHLTIPVKTENDLMLSELAKITGLGESTITKAFKKIKIEMDLYQADSDTNPEPAIVIERVKTSYGTADTIKREALPKFFEKYVNYLKVPDKTEEDLIVSDVAAQTGVSIKSVNDTFRKLEAEWKLYNTDTKNNLKPKIEIKTIKTGGNPATAIDLKDLEKFRENYLPLSFVRIKSENDLMAVDLAKITGLSKGIIFDIFSKIEKDWQNYKENPETNLEPLVKLEKIRDTGPPANSINVQDLVPLFTNYYPKILNEFLEHGDEMIARARINRHRPPKPE